MIRWRKSSRSQGEAQGNCVEVARTGETALIRDSKDPDGPRLTLTRGHLRDLIAGVKNGRYDPQV
jgi:hypothetical protein